MVACLLIFIPLSYWYKLRNRDDIFNYHIAVEDFYENDLNRREQYNNSADAEQLMHSDSLLPNDT